MNIILIMSDTLRKDHLGCYGNKTISTPNLDDFADNCIQFNNCFAGSFPTVPNRADLFTGKFTFPELGWGPLPREEETLSQRLDAAGYATIACVDTPFLLRGGYGYDRGFQVFDWIAGQKSVIWSEEAKKLYWERRYEQDYCAPKTFATAEQYLERYREKKFFLYIDTWDPHEPWDPPAWYVESYYPQYSGQIIEPCYGKWREHGRKKEEVEIAHACYCGEVTMVDQWFGRFINKLRCMRLLDNTIIIFTSDHGYYFGEHGYFGKMVRDWKTVGDWHYSPLYQEITRIPLLFYLPGVKGRITEAVVQPCDLMPTLLELAGVEPHSNCYGRSFVSVLRGKTESFRDFAVTSPPLYNPGETTRVVDDWERTVKEPLPTTITDDGWTLLYSRKNHPAELYNIRQDPDESNNLIEKHFDKAKKLHSKFIELLEAINTEPRYLEPRKFITKRANNLKAVS